ncbi:MAG: hypothetical protein ACSHYA_16150 [Opitutaceae bacterium]
MKYHDYHLLSYVVDCQGGLITLSLGRPAESEIPNEKIIFTGVVGYHFLDAMGSIILDIREEAMSEFFEQNFEAFRESSKLNGIPKFWRDELDETLEVLEEKRLWSISSSIGFDGYVIASEIDQPDSTRVDRR